MMAHCDVAVACVRATFCSCCNIVLAQGQVRRVNDWACTWSRDPRVTAMLEHVVWGRSSSGLLLFRNLACSPVSMSEVVVGRLLGAQVADHSEAASADGRFANKPQPPQGFCLHQGVLSRPPSE